jgi:murein DD-endopeptidase MepM/ murein hydrolase activator NlpD
MSDRRDLPREGAFEARRRAPAAGKPLAALAAMAARFYRIIIVPDAEAPLEALRVPALAVRAAAVCLVLAMLASGFLVCRYVQVHAVALAMQRDQLEAPAVSLARVRHIIDDLARLNDLDQKLRVTAGLAPFQDTRIGRGGSRAETALEDADVRLVDRLPADLRSLEEEMSSRAQGLLELTRFVEARRDVLAATPTIWPVEGLLTDDFGRRRSPFTGRSEMHEGLDLAAPLGTPVRAAADGVVTFAGPLASFGTVVSLRHGHGFTTLYAHLGRTTVKPGQTLSRGTTIGLIGLTGRTTGPHVHYEVHQRGTPVNPMLYIVDARAARRAVAAALPGGAGQGGSGRLRMTAPDPSSAAAGSGDG